MSQSSSNAEEEQLYQILCLLELTYTSKDTNQIKSAQESLKTFSSNILIFTNLLLKSLFITSIKEKKITLELHKSVVLYLRNVIFKSDQLLKPEELYEIIKQFISAIFSWDKNNNVNNPGFASILLNIICSLLSTDSIKQNSKYIQSLASDTSKLLLESNNQYNNENNILITCQKLIGLYISFINSKSLNTTNYESVIKTYFFPIADKILELAKNYINPGINMYNDKYILILKSLYDCFYTILLFYKNTLSDENLLKKEFFFIYGKYWKYCYELIELSPQFDEPTTKKFQKPNPIIVFNAEEKNSNNINLMKSRVIQFNCYVIQNLWTISNDYDFNKSNDNEITDKDLISFIIKVIKLIVKSFEDILSNKEKFCKLRNYEMENLTEENSLNILLYELCVFLSRVLIRQPFKNIFQSDIKVFMLNILFPLFSTNESERNSIETDSDAYHGYLNDILEQFKMRNFRTSGMFLINKICNFFPDESNFVLSFTLEMFNYIINKGNINNKVNYNIYTENKDKYMIDKLDDETKVDLFLLLLILLKEQIGRNNLFRNHLKTLFIKNQEKLNQIQSLAIKIKLCKIYYIYIPLLFKDQDNIHLAEKKLYNSKVNNKENDIISDILPEEHYKFIQNSIDYLLRNIAQNISENTNNIDHKNYYKSLSQSAAESLSELINSFKKTTYEETEEGGQIVRSEKYTVVNKYISECLSKYFKVIINLIIIINNSSFFYLIDYTLEFIKPQNRQDIFICLNNMTEKFVQDMKIEKQNKDLSFVIEYFKILSKYLKGINKLDKNNPKEIEIFDNALEKVFKAIDIENLEKFDESDDLYETMGDYMTLLESINDKCIRIFKKIASIVENEKAFSNSIFSFLCQFMKYLPKTKNLDAQVKSQIVTYIINIIKLGFSFEDELYNYSIKNSLLLTLELFNISIHEIPFNILKDLLLFSCNSFSPITKEDILMEETTDKFIITQLILCNVFFSFIFRPTDTFKIIFEKQIKDEELKIKVEPKKDNNNKNKEKENNLFLSIFFNIIITNIGIVSSEYIILINKCVILGLCSIFKEKYCSDKLDAEKNVKILLYQIFAKLMEKHKKQQVYQLNKIMKRETCCNFIEEQESEDDDDITDEDEDIEDIKENIEDILNQNENIKNADEYKYFNEIINDLKNKEKPLFEEIQKNFKLEDILPLRNININYKGKEYIIPRKTVKILKKK